MKIKHAISLSQHLLPSCLLLSIIAHLIVLNYLLARPITYCLWFKCGIRSRGDTVAP